MSKNTTNRAVKIAKEIVLGLKCTDNLIEIDSLYAFYRSALYEAYNARNLTKEEYIDLVDIATIMIGKKDTH